MLVVEADERRSLLNAEEEDELGRGLCEAVIVFAAGLMLTFRDSFLPFATAGDVEEEEQEATPSGRATDAAAADPGAPTAFRLDVDERPVAARKANYVT